jgi:hypothetical protein
MRVSVKRELICGKLREADLNDLSMTLHRVEPAQGIDLEKERLKKLRGSFFELNPTLQEQSHAARQPPFFAAPRLPYYLPLPLIEVCCPECLAY